MKRLKLRIIVEGLGLGSVLSLCFWVWGRNLVALGILIGTFTGIVCFQLLARHILASVSCGLRKVQPYFFLKYLIRYAIMGVVLFFCARIGLNLFLGASAGLVLIYLVIFLDTFIINKAIS